MEAAESTVRIALGDVTPVEQAALLVAPERATEEFFQLSERVFCPAAETRQTSWQDMNGEPLSLHFHRGGTDAIASFIETREAIELQDRS